MNPLTKNDLLEVLENSTLAQLRALRALRRSQERKRPPSEPGRKSNMHIVHDILVAAKAPSMSAKSSSAPKRTTAAHSGASPSSAP